MFKSEASILSNKSILPYFPFINFYILAQHKLVTSTMWWYLIESLPKKSNSTLSYSGNLRCSTLKEQQPTVSASSSPFSFPTLKANLSIK